MELNSKILFKIIELQKSSKLDFTLIMDSKTFPLKNVLIKKSSVPVTRPTKRGGVYFSDTSVYTIKSKVYDFLIIPLLSKSMLGPNQDFQDLKIITQFRIDNSLKKINLFAHLTNYMRSSSYIELNMKLIKITYLDL